MGTNYYQRTEICECCGRYDEKHIGKSSAGWQFSFRGYNAEEHRPAILSFKDWKRELKNGKIFDEYGREMPYEDFLAFVEEKKSQPNNHFDYCVKNNLSRETDFKDPDGHSFSNTEFS